MRSVYGIHAVQKIHILIFKIYYIYAWYRPVGMSPFLQTAAHESRVKFV